MYLEHFKLSRPPFSITPDTAFFMSRAGYQDALNVLLVALRSGEGFVKVTGEVGTGKTLLCRTLLNTLESEGYACAYIPNPYLTPESLLHAVGEELGISDLPAPEDHAFVKRLQDALMSLHQSGKRIVVCLDETQAMPVPALETLRLLTNLETETSKLLQVVMFGQPELDEVLSQPSVRQLRQRITFSYELLPLNRAGLEQYIGHRLGVAGYTGLTLFTRGTRDALFATSRGIPRLVNILAHKSLMAAYGEGSATVTVKHLRRAVEDTADARDWNRPQRWMPSWRWRVAGAVGVVLTFGAGAALQQVLAYVL